MTSSEKKSSNLNGVWCSKIRDTTESNTKLKHKPIQQLVHILGLYEKNQHLYDLSSSSSTSISISHWPWKSFPKHPGTLFNKNTFGILWTLAPEDQR
ncbi:hypothetical protein JCM33374_g3985 [Metschnikowia sp. JCM 33374]|nr:hypothetical protein JCM33374_g3985 [Metschnikowia sp. JCM 33374]